MAEYMFFLEDQALELEISIQKVHEQPIGQVILNVIDNSIQYGIEGRFLGVTLSETAATVQIAITDRGRGIAEEEQQNIFRRFYLVDKGRQSNGAGIGLSISEEIMKKHGGSITVESRPYEWTTFTLTIPKRDSDVT
ncbi:MAG: sensor histidine kinase [Paenibacillaceae bacterium]